MYSEIEMQEIMQKLAKRRRKGKIAFGAGVVLLAVLPLQGYLPVVNAWRKDLTVIFVIPASIFLLIYGALVRIVAQARLKDIISGTLVPEALNRVFSHLEYNQEQHIPSEYIDAALVQHYWESTGGNDYVRADYRGVPVEFSDLCLKYVTGIGEKSRTRIAYRGLWLVCSLAPDFQSELLLISRRILFLGFRNTPENFYPLLSGNAELDKKFVILSDNPQDAQAILTSQTAEGVLRLYEYTNGRTSLKIARDGKVHAAVSSDRNLFEPGKRLEDAERQITAEIDNVTGIIDLLYDIPALNRRNIVFEIKELGNK